MLILSAAVAQLSDVPQHFFVCLQLQDAVGNIAKGFGALQQGVFGGGQQGQGQPSSRQPAAQVSAVPLSH